MSEGVGTAAAPAADGVALKPSWRDSLRVYLAPTSLRLFALGFSAGLPLLLVLGTLSFRLREAGIDRSTIGYLSWVGLAYGFKWVWVQSCSGVAVDGLAPAAGCDWVRAINQWAVCKHCRQKSGGGLVILLVHARHSGGAATNPGQAPVLRSTRAAARRGLDYHGPHHVHLLTPQPPVQPRR